MASRSPQDCGVRCDLCGKNQFKLLHEWPVGDRWNPATVPLTLWQCEQCRLAFLYPVPTSEQLPDAGDWWSPKRQDIRRRRWLKRRLEKMRAVLFGHYRQRLIKSSRRAVKSGRLLDVGCGRGELMERAKEYYECVGLEPSPIAARILKENGFSVVQSTFEDARFTESSFDLVILDSVIEHVQSPTEILRKINSVLRMHGVVALRTPKFGGPSCRRHGGGWNGFRHGYHTYLFSARTLGAYLEKMGFRVLNRPRRDRMLDDILILWAEKVIAVE